MREKQITFKHAMIWIVIAALLLSVAIPTSFAQADQKQPKAETAQSEGSAQESEQKPQDDQDGTGAEPDAGQGDSGQDQGEGGDKPEEPAAPQPESVTLNKKEVNVAVGKRTQLRATVAPSDAENKTVTWTSSSPRIATVTKDGLVKAVHQGYTIITAKTANGKKATCRINTKLERPTQVRSKRLAYNKVKLTWKPSPEADGYDIYRRVGKTGKFVRINKYGVNDERTSYTDSKVTVGTTHYYKVRAYQILDGKRRSSELSTSMAYRKVRLTAPTLKSASAGERSVTIRWNGIIGTTKYAIYRATSKKGTYRRIATASASSRSYTNKNLTGGKTYYYKVKAYRTVKGTNYYSDASNVRYATAKKPKRPYNSQHNFYYKDKFTVKAYAYTGGGYTAMGTKARVGEIAVDPRVIPLGTRVYVEGYGFARAEDTGGNIKGKTIDVYMNSSAACYRWGVRYKTIYTGVVRAD